LLKWTDGFKVTSAGACHRLIPFCTLLYNILPQESYHTLPEGKCGATQEANLRWKDIKLSRNFLSNIRSCLAVFARLPIHKHEYRKFSRLVNQLFSFLRIRDSARKSHLVCKYKYRKLSVFVNQLFSTFEFFLQSLVFIPIITPWIRCVMIFTRRCIMDALVAIIFVWTPRIIPQS